MSTFPNLRFVWQWSHTYLLCISSPHAKSLHLAVLPDAADVVHLLKDSLGSAAHRHRTEFDKTEGNLQNINMSKQLLAQSSIWTSVNDRLQITLGHFLWHLMKPLEQPARTPFWIHTLHMYSVIYFNQMFCHFYLCWSVLYMLHLLHACPSWERYPSSVAPPEASSCFSFIRCTVAKKGVSGVTDLLTSWSNSRLWLRCSNWLFFTRQLLFSSTWPFMWEWSPPPLSSFRWLICAAASTRIKLGNIPLIECIYIQYKAFTKRQNEKNCITMSILHYTRGQPRN